MYDTHTLKPPPPVSSSYSPSPEPTDDISILLRQILCKSSSSPSSFSFSSSSSSPFCSPKQMKCEIPPPYSSELTVPTLSSAVAPNIPAISVCHVSSSSPGAIGYVADEYDCESEEAFENLMEEMVARPNPPLNPSKRTRAAEVHNISEKRRRSRINEKMKALQKLIPNSSKMDKASMLDEAIEYLKQLQLQVQMLTMRNGMNLNSMCAPHGVLLQPSHRPSGMNQGKQSINMSTTHGTFVNPILSQNQSSIPEFSRTINQDPSFGTQPGSY